MPFIRDVSANYHSDKPSECYARRYTCMVHVGTYIALRPHRSFRVMDPQYRDILELHCIHLQSWDKPVVQGNQSKKVLPLNRPSKNGRNRSETAVCRNYNSQKGCTFTECKLRHVCILPGCNQSHSALNHITEKTVLFVCHY